MPLRLNGIPTYGADEPDSMGPPHQQALFDWFVDDRVAVVVADGAARGLPSRSGNHFLVIATAE
ncbi:hypothetical protein CHU95_11420 [Niveispirillum lacus]|uniref:Uncharacterized protein n=1 Tax=Niveispirillum lacus TaxID=1981099 RepID=A0A255Z0Y7_9PROT|nr:hypothetical protein CHU95_11420 [Niveispirillum lacus]